MYKVSDLAAEYRKKLITADEAAAMVQNGDRLHLVAQNLRTLYFLIRYSGGGCQFDIIFL